jgi:uncharacterized protein DUF2604
MVRASLTSRMRFKMDSSNIQGGTSGKLDPADRNKFAVTVTYNGLGKSLEVNRNQSLNAVLQHALKLFGVTADPGGFRLLVEATGAELNLNQSVEDAGVIADTRLVLAPRVVSGGK